MPIINSFKGSQAIVEVNLAAIYKNWQYFSSLMKTNGSKVAAVVKANAYGLGAIEITKYLASKGVSDFFVKNEEEAIALRQAEISANISAFSGYIHGYAKDYLHYNIVPVINDISDLVALHHDCSAANIDNFPVIIHMDTSMNRLGIRVNEWQKLTPEDKYFQRLNILYIMTHLSHGATPHHERNQEQFLAFQKATAAWQHVKTSIGSTAGIAMGENFQGDMSRLGIGLYGHSPFSDNHEIDKHLTTVFTISAPILQIRDVLKGETIGYDGIWTAQRDSKVAIIAIGYADGFRREQTFKYANIANHKADIIGKISMDLTALDITDINTESISTNTHAVITASDMPMAEFAKRFNCSNYEALTSMTSSLKKVYR